MQNTKYQKLTLTVGAILLTIILVVLFKITNDEHQKQIEVINKRFAPKMAQCWSEVAETGQTCRLEYIYIDDGQTIVSARVIKQ